MGWQEYPENDDNFLPLTEDELREFQTKTEQVSSQSKRWLCLRLAQLSLSHTLNDVIVFWPAEEERHSKEWGSPEDTGCDPPLHPLEECGGGTRRGGLRVRNQ